MLAPVLAARDVADMVQDAEFLWLVGALVATLLVGALLLAWLDRWRKRQLSNSPRADVEQIGFYRAMFERGELTKEEYDRVLQKEAQRVREKLGMPQPKLTPPVEPTREPPAQPSLQEPETPPPPA